MKVARVLQAVCMACVLASIAAAEQVVFTVDPAASYLTAGGAIDGRTLGEQTPGSLRTGLTGTLDVDINRVAGTISLGADVTLGQQPVPQRPGWQTTDPSPALFGMAAGPAANPLYANIDSFTPSITLTNAPLDGGLPQVPDEASMWISGGSLYYMTDSGSSRYVDLHGYGSLQSTLGPVTLTRSGDVETLTVPLRTEFPITNGTDDVTLSFDGQLVATRVVPEPAGGLLAVASVTTILRRRRAARP